MILNIINFAGSLCFLLYGMKLMSDGIQKSAGQKLQAALAFMTGNRFVGLLTGCILTMIIQSSGATTVMLVSFVNAGLVTVTQAIGVIFGANIGTTVTGWIVALGSSFEIKDYAIPIFGLGYLLYILKRFKSREGFWLAIMGFGLLFFGLGGLSDFFAEPAVKSIVIQFISIVNGFGVISYAIGLFIGIILTALIHSSSAMSAIVIGMAVAMSKEGNASVEELNEFWRFGAVMIIGSSVGSTVDAILAAIGANANARRTAAVHVLFNVATVIIALIFFRPFIRFVEIVSPGHNIVFRIAMLNTAFKLMGTVIFIPFVNQISRFVEIIIKDDKIPEETVYKLEFNERMAIESPEGCVFRAQSEVKLFSDMVAQMFDELQAGFANFSPDFITGGYEMIVKTEDYCDQMNEQLTQYLVRCTHLHLSDEAKDNAALMMQLIAEMEAMADGCLNIAYQLKKAIEKEMTFNKEDFDRLLPYFELARQLMFFIYKNVARIQRLTPEQFQFASELEQQIDDERKELKRIARKRLESGSDVRSELLYMDIIRQIEKIGDRCFDAAGDLR
ncbi:MAG: Na/Pi cotransporter family protein [Treponema sp.]|uniref:Na/Pi cotransporter family protein n=1 Tax=Treponema sp. TaxID=166 RepID=UPI0025DA3953|nr:Na/Pi cotransporter family protein [Treponema sp.]MBQ9282910.1 Na/Pi cotransporter family protein [Treponema sp.]